MIKKFVIGKKIGRGVQSSLLAEKEILSERFNYELHIVTQDSLVVELGKSVYVQPFGRLYFFILSRLMYGFYFRVLARNSSKVIFRLTGKFDVQVLFWLFSGTHIFLEVHELINLKLKHGKFNYLIIRLLFCCCKKVTFICVTKELQTYYSKVFKCSSIFNPNGVNRPVSKSVTNKLNKIQKILFVSSTFNKYSGIERLLNLLNNIEFNGELVLVGNTSSLNLNEGINEKYHSFSIILIAEIAEDVLDSVCSYCDIAISSLGNDQSELHEGSRLKVRGYLARGLPVVSNELDFVLNSLEHFYYCQSDQEVKEVIKNLLIKKNSKQDVMTLADNFIDKSVMMKPLINALN